VVGRLIRWIATPPADVEFSEDELEVYAVTIWATLIGLIAHASWVPLFAALGFTELAIVNVFSTLAFVGAIWLCRRMRLAESLVVTAAEVVGHAWIATYFLGLGSAFHALALLAMMLGILFTTMSIRARVTYALSISGIWVGLVAAGLLLFEPAYEVSEDVRRSFLVMNAVVFVAVLAGMTLYHSWRVTLTREARKLAREDLAAAVQRTQVIVEQMADGLVAFGPDLRVTALNRALAGWLGESEVDVDASTSTSVEVALPEMRAVAQKVLSTGEIASADVPLPGGRVGAAVGTPIEPDGAVVLIRDVTAAKEVDRMKSEFTAMVSHELRTPLTSVLGFAKLVKKQLTRKILPATDLSEPKVARAAERASEQLDIILVEGERLTALINDVLDLAKMEAGKMDLSRQEIAVAEVVGRAVAATSTLFRSDSVVCESSIDSGLPSVVADPDRLQQVLVNLISNAAKFTDEGTVTVSAGSSPDGVRFTVRDTGPGIPEAEQALVFEKFRQAKGAAARPGGTGLGLPICREIVHAHNGSIGVESEVGEGTEFWFMLPLAG